MREEVKEEGEKEEFIEIIVRKRKLSNSIFLLIQRRRAKFIKLLSRNSLGSIVQIMAPAAKESTRSKHPVTAQSGQFIISILCCFSGFLTDDS